MSTLAKSDLLILVQSVAAVLRKQWDRELRARIPELSMARATVILQLGRTGGASQTRLARLLLCRARRGAQGDSVIGVGCPGERQSWSTSQFARKFFEGEANMKSFTRMRTDNARRYLVEISRAWLRSASSLVCDSSHAMISLPYGRFELNVADERFLEITLTADSVVTITSLESAVSDQLDDISRGERLRYQWILEHSHEPIKSAHSSYLQFLGRLVAPRFVAAQFETEPPANPA